MAFKIGVMADSFRLDPRDGIRKAAEIGVEGVQIYAVEGEISPERLDELDRRELEGFCSEQGLEIAALCGDLGGHGFNRPAENPGKIERSKAIVDLAADLGTDVVTTHIGIVPADAEGAEYEMLSKACRELGDYARDRGVTFAVETGPETAETLGEFLADVGSPGIGVNLDPANFAMVTGDDPVQAVYTLADRIVHTHAKDGVKYRECDPVAVYTAFAEGGIEALNMGELFAEVPLGQGSVDWDSYLDALRAIGYTGFLTIEREVGDDPEEDIRTAVEFLRARTG